MFSVSSELLLLGGNDPWPLISKTIDRNKDHFLIASCFESSCFDCVGKALLGWVNDKKSSMPKWIQQQS
ncbi:hypothetical protein SynA1825c_02048 [Synechococcus sp. A18-25c]|uniref:hypothetical protein n=1 Tax=Synechococcus sp. A18-25c TaxID=1866938 RepID=UPI0016461FA2|nr:hypothetical protein [Synechococcus sp. A18-25c]QNI48719.1 hypothetical protein SynA1560_02065 [Synechococcus sp. A15-60]QNJ20348.1 hypothetical protein SynA1825c_02048 [Synechococcus sp. A18-25c]